MTAAYERMKLLPSNGCMFLSRAKEVLWHNKDVSPYYLIYATADLHKLQGNHLVKTIEEVYEL
jgi:hypothetical protein